MLHYPCERGEQNALGKNGKIVVYCICMARNIRPGCTEIILRFPNCSINLQHLEQMIA